VRDSCAPRRTAAPARTPPVWSWKIAGRALTALPVLPGVRSTTASTRNEASASTVSVEMRQQLVKKAVYTAFAG